MLKNCRMKYISIIQVWCLAFVGLSIALQAENPEGGFQLCLNQQTNGIHLAVNASENFTNRVEIYSCTNLTDGIWNIAAQDVPFGGTNSAAWTAAPATVCFFKAGNMDVDNDFDGINDAQEMYIHKTSPDRWDSDGDWLPDNWEIEHSLNALISEGILDSDRDGLNNRDEYQNGTNPFDADSDHDGMPDLREVKSRTDPQTNDSGADPDGDQLTNYEEFTANTNPFKPDTDEDGIPDGFEATCGMNPCNPHDALDDLDGDMVPNFYEYINGGTDPSDPASTPEPSAVINTSGYAGTFTNMQTAINAVATNEYPIIFIEPGDYSIDATIELLLANILIYAEPGTAILDGRGSNRLFSAVSGWPIIAGLTMQNGYSADDGGAIHISAAKPAVRNCFFLSNQAGRNGGAIYAGSYASEIINCVFNDNEALNGGAIYCEASGSKMKNCTWISNHALNRGGAIYNGVVINGVAWSNRADGAGAQIYGTSVSYSCVEGGCNGQSNITEVLHLVYGWHLTSADSLCVNAGNATNAATHDLDGELRDFLPDIGADEWMDSDSDGLPDWWEIRWFGNLNSIMNGNIPADDGDGRFSYIQKYLYELNPNISDCDGDELSDYAEIFIYNTNPHINDTPSVSVGYTIEQTGYEWMDISQTGQAITNFGNLDDGVAQILLGIQFPFSDTTYASAYVCNNGFISFGERSAEFDNESLPSARIPEKALCVFWDDFRMENDTNATVYIQTCTNQCIISFIGIPFWDRSLTNRLSFQAILQEDGCIRYQYKDASGDGSLSTVGMQWGEGSVGFYSGNITNGTALFLSNRNDADIDFDGVNDAWETKWFGSLGVVVSGRDFAAGTNRFTYAESAYLGINPNVTDTDGDGLSDVYEVEHGMSPVTPQDSDGDGIPDFYETSNGLNPVDSSDALLDPDGDNFLNVYEYQHTIPFSASSVPSPTRYVSLSGTHTAPFTNRATAATNIQAALAGANAYDIIQLADGIYMGPENRNLNISGKPLLLLSENGPTDCILDCESEGRGFSIIGSATRGSVIRGIKLFSGYSAWGYSYNDGYGGAMYCEDTQILFENCRICSNDADNRGGAICGKTASVIFKNCIFESNGGKSAGGVCYFDENSIVKMLGCTMTETLGDEGVYCFDSRLLIQDSLFSNNLCCTLYGDLSLIQIERSLFSDNYAPHHSGGVYFYDTDAIISNCVFRNNSVESNGWGAGALCQEHTELRAQNCLFSGNSAKEGVIYVQSGSTCLQNCTIVSNQSSALCRYFSGDITVRNTVLWGNTFGSYNSADGLDVTFSCLPERTGTNNIFENPKLITETGELLPDSPCIDRGSDMEASEMDLCGTLRWDHPWRSNNVDLSVADIGMLEFADSDSDADGMGDKWEIYYFTNITFSSGADDDRDGLSTLDEYKLNTSPVLTDTDGDTLSDSDEIITYGTSPLSSDSDRDGLSDTDEINTYGTDSLRADSDHDGLPDGWEIANRFSPLLANDASTDLDDDGLNNLAEYILGTDFRSRDSDHDGIPDGWESANSLNPLIDDSADDPDGDGFSNLVEYQADTDPQDMDRDDDGMPNAWETAHGLNLAVDDALGDPDGDGLTNLEEYKAQTNPQSKDTDSDRLDDKKEVRILHTSPLLNDTDGDGVDDWFELDQGRDPLTDESAQPAGAVMEALGGGVTAMTSAYSASILADDFDDDGQLNVDELHRYPRIVIMADTHYPSPSPEFLFNEAVVKEDTRWVCVVGSGSGPLYAHAKEFYGEPGRKYGLNEILDVANSEPHPVLSKGVWISSHFSWSGGTPGVPLTTNSAGTYLYPYACTYRIETAVAGAWGRKMCLNINDDDDNADGISDCNDDAINGSADTNDMGLVVFKQMVIHPNAPSPHIYLSASPEVRLFRASTRQPIRVYRHGGPWSDETEDIGDELRNGDVAVLVEGISPSLAPSQTADNTVNGWPYIPPYYGVGDPTSQGTWGTYVGLYCKDDVDRYPSLENDMIRFSVEVKPNIHIIPDWNRDRQITEGDKGWNTDFAPFRFWINDDNDAGDIAEGNSDIPGQGSGRWGKYAHANYEDKKVNGRSDLTDFFPVWLDISSVLTSYPVGSGIEYRLRQADSALQFIYTDLSNTNAGDYLITEIAFCGPAFCQNVRDSDTIKVTAEGIVLDSVFLDRIAASPDKGVLIMEAVGLSTAPLVLEVVSNGTVCVKT